MIAAEDLITLVGNYNPKSNAKLLLQAYQYGMKMHDGQFRHSGEAYFTHPVAVAAILSEHRLDDHTIVTALLHDTIEDTKSTYTEISALFGEDVARLVDGIEPVMNRLRIAVLPTPESPTRTTLRSAIELEVVLRLDSRGGSS